MSEGFVNTTSHIGGPSEDNSGRVRKGQLDWVIGIAKATDFKSWSFKFKVGATTYLSKAVYPVEEERRYAWLNALIRAASLGGFEEMNELLELYDDDGVRCEDILKKLQDRFLPASDIEKRKATNAFMTFVRGNKSLSEAAKNLRVIILECHKYGYRPDAETLKAKYESILFAVEVPIFRLYVKNNDSEEGTSELDMCIRAIEDLGKDQEGVKSESGGAPEFAGGAFASRKGDPRRKGFVSSNSNSDEQDAGKSSKSKCTKCGKKCPASKGGPKEKCYAFEKECRKCGELGHFEVVCRIKSASKANAAASDEQQQSGF